MNFKKINNCIEIIMLSILLMLSCKSFGDENKNLDLKLKILNEKDIRLYKQIFDHQSKVIKGKNSKTWKKINLIKKNISNQILFGTIQAEKYLHPTGWRSTYTELKKWLDLYGDHPDAYRIYRLAKKRKPKNSKYPKKPVGNFLNGYGNILKDQLKPSFPMISKGHKYPKSSFRIAIKVRRGIRKEFRSLSSISENGKTYDVVTLDLSHEGVSFLIPDSLKDEIMAAKKYEIELFDRISKKAIKLDGKIKHSTNYGPIGGENYTRVGFVFSNLPLAKEVTTKIMDSNIERIVNNSMLSGREDGTKKAS